jgi:hypothetical protein
MKITVDEGTFNKAIFDGKLELANWLLQNTCPYDQSVYVQNFNIQVLNWLKSKDILVPKNCLSSVIDKTSDQNVINWFLSNGVTIDKASLNACIRNSRNELLTYLITQSGLSLDIDSYKTAILSENIVVLDRIKVLGIEIDDTIVEIALKNKKKNSIKWLVLNNLF